MDLRTTYMGLQLKNPLVASASPLTESLDNLRRLEEAGASAVVLFSLFEEQIKQETANLEHFLTYGTESFQEAQDYFPEVSEFRMGIEAYLELVHKASSTLEIPVIGSLNGISSDGWVKYAKKIQDAGAKALELNIFYLPTDARYSGQEVERMYLDVIRAVKATVTIPVALKLSPFFSSMSHMARQIDQMGVEGMVLFNRFYQPDFDLENLEVLPSLELSHSSEMRLALLWISVLYGRVKSSLAATTGVHTGKDAIKYIMAGADAVMTTSALLKHGIKHLDVILKEMTQWLTEHEYTSVAQCKGSMSQSAVENPTVFERANYIRTLGSYTAHRTQA